LQLSYLVEDVERVVGFADHLEPCRLEHAPQSRSVRRL